MLTHPPGDEALRVEFEDVLSAKQLALLLHRAAAIDPLVNTIFKFDPQGFVPGRVSQHDDNFIDGSWKGSAKPKTSSSRT
jgi:hypothetical protein